FVLSRVLPRLAAGALHVRPGCLGSGPSLPRELLRLRSRFAGELSAGRLRLASEPSERAAQSPRGDACLLVAGGALRVDGGLLLGGGGHATSVVVRGGARRVCCRWPRQGSAVPVVPSALTPTLCRNGRGARGPPSRCSYFSRRSHLPPLRPPLPARAG